MSFQRRVHTISVMCYLSVDLEMLFKHKRNDIDVDKLLAAYAYSSSIVVVDLALGAILAMDSIIPCTVQMKEQLRISFS